MPIGKRKNKTKLLLKLPLVADYFIPLLVEIIAQVIFQLIKPAVIIVADIIAMLLLYFVIPHMRKSTQ